LLRGDTPSATTLADAYRAGSPGSVSFDIDVIAPSSFTPRSLLLPAFINTRLTRDSPIAVLIIATANAGICQQYAAPFSVTFKNSRQFQSTIKFTQLDADKLTILIY